VLGADGAAAGEVVRAAATGSGVELLAVVVHSRRHALTIGDPRRPLLELPLPYEVPAA
jgi:hypothetical protein